MNDHKVIPLAGQATVSLQNTAQYADPHTLTWECSTVTAIAGLEGSKIVRPTVTSISRKPSGMDTKDLLVACFGEELGSAAYLDSLTPEEPKRPNTISPDEARKLYGNRRPVIYRVSDGQMFVRQPDGLYVGWDDDPKLREPLCLQHRYEERMLPAPDFV